MFKMSLVFSLLLFAVSCFGSIGVDVTPNSWNVGTGGAGTYVSPSVFTVTNTGTDPANVRIRATNTNKWTLSNSAGLNIFAMQWGTEPNWNSITTANRDILQLTGGSSYGFNLRYQSPTDISDRTLTEPQTSTITVVVEALPVTNYVFLRKWGSYGTSDGQFWEPSDIVLDAESNVYVADYGNSRIQKFTSDGTFITKWGNYQSRGITIDSIGNIYVADEQKHCIFKLSSDGTFITKWGSEGSGDGQFESPNGITIDSTGNIYVADINNYRIQKFTSDGTFITKWGSQGSNNGQFDYPSDIEIDINGNVYVVDIYNNRIQKFSSNGTFITKWGSYGTGDGQFNSPWGIAVDASGNVYVADTNNHRIQKFTSDGTFITKWGSSGSGDGMFSVPRGIIVDGSGNVFVADMWLCNVQVFGPQQ